MASVDKVKVGSTSYDISPSKDGTLNGFTSNDAASPTAWSAANAITTSDTNSTIFSKVTTMIKNVRWLYSKLGTTDFSATGQSTVTGALSALQTGLNGKAASSHSHTTAQLPISSSQTNSNSYIPTSALVYSIQQQITSLNDTIVNLEFQVDDPNDRNYTSTNLGTWSSASDVDTFLSRFNRSTAYKDGNTKLRIGNYVTIQDGTYNAVWEIAGFDMESNQEAADGTTYDNGYGICLIPQTQLTTANWNVRNTVAGAYMSSTMHTTVLPDIVTNLQNVLGSHIVQRNVLLSSSVDSDYHSNAYTWTTAYATLMSVGQMNGTFAANRNKYDDGEANYRLPIFIHTEYNTGSNFWSRGVWGRSGGGGDYRYHARCVHSDGRIGAERVTNTYGVRPLIYLR